MCIGCLEALSASNGADLKLLGLISGVSGLRGPQKYAEE